MKFNNIKKYLFIVAGISMTMTSCLKDKDYNNGNIQSLQGGNTAVISTALDVATTKNFLALGVANSSNDTVVNLIPVKLSPSLSASQDIHVTLVQSDSALAAYNALNTDTTVTADNPNPTGKITHLVPPTKFSLVNPGGVVIIPKGSNVGYLQIKFKPSDFLGGPTYGLAYIITSVAEKGYVISGNINFGVVAINIKNQWDGTYHTTGTRVHPTLGPFPFSYNVALNTTGVSTIEGLALADLKQDLAITINPDNTVTLASTYTGVLLTAGGVNKYDPATKTFTLTYFYNTGAPRTITQTLTLKK